MPDRLVIDASVVAKWFLSDEADKDAADKLLLLLLADEIEMSAPRVQYRHRAAPVRKRWIALGLTAHRSLTGATLERNN